MAKRATIEVVSFPNPRSPNILITASKGTLELNEQETRELYDELRARLEKRAGE